MGIKILKNTISRKELVDVTKKEYGNLVKAVVDVEQEIMAIGGELHSDEEVALMEQEGSKREHTWGINLYPEVNSEEWIEYDSVINLKPGYDNRSRGVDNPEVRKKIRKIVEKLVSK